MTLQAHIGQVVQELETTLLQIDETAITRLSEHIQAVNRIFITGRGRSGLQMSGFAMRLMQMGFETHIVGDMTTPAIQADDLLIIGSGSGQTGSLISFAETAKTQNATIALLTIALQSPLRDYADLTLIIPASTPKLEGPQPTSILPMGSRFEFSLAILCELVVLHLMAQMGISEADMFARHANME